MPASLNRARPKNFLSTMLRLFSYFEGKMLFLLVLVVLLAIYSSVANILGTYLSGTVVIHTLEENLGSGMPLEESLSILYGQALKLVAIYVAGVISNILYAQIMVRLTQKVLYRLRKELMAKMHRLPISYFDRHTHGEVMTYFTNDIDSLVAAMNDSFANIVLSLSNIVGTVVSLFLINVYLSLIVLFFVAAMIFFMFLNSHKAQKYYKAQQKALSEVNSAVEEDVLGVKVIKAFSHEEESFVRFMKANGNWKEASERAFFFTQLNIPIFVSLSYLNFSISAVVGVLFLTNGMIATGIGGLSSYLVFVRTSCQPFNFFAQHLNAILSASAGAERIFAFLDEEEERDDGQVVLEKISDEKDFCRRYAWRIPGDDTLRPLVGRIAFEHVDFSYIPGKPVLKDISFEAWPGKKVAFVGSTGAGKTTIISLLARFYSVDSGRITYDGIDIQDIALESLRRALSMVTQDTHLFTGSVKDNIRYVRLHSTDEEIRKASRRSHAESFIERLPQGYDTLLHDDGGNLSEGERQLLGLTRASLNQPPVLILDEATSNIDTRSEKLIHEGLKSLMGERTVLVIAHRLSTIKDAQEILVLEEGRIIERGSQEELLKKKGAYYDLYTGRRELA